MFYSDKMYVVLPIEDFKFCVVLRRKCENSVLKIEQINTLVESK